ncbi:hypothetical protein BDV25DRAFT_164338 [Aspergillus avenaceus]|uniref:Uncharacterized protein n=1 Tax=Aspergillus avenaceus TaxID=36643 RepID=A0A5N6THF3_ASPAV|nr:hypothetical protein BDV25DRAFT_164338 [Aspergillus avenaceus]
MHGLTPHHLTTLRCHCGLVSMLAIDLSRNTGVWLLRTNRMSALYVHNEITESGFATPYLLRSIIPRKSVLDAT